MTRARLIPPILPTMPKTATCPMPHGDAQDPPVDSIALAAAQEIDALLVEQMRCPRAQRVANFQIRIEAAINEALDRCQALGGRRVK